MYVFKKILCIFSGFILVTLPATSVSAASTSSSGVLINEIQTESIDDPNLEFVEIINTSSTVVDLDGWKLQYRAASGASWTTKSTLAGQIYPGGSIVISTIGYLPDNSTFHWTGVGGQLASTGGNLLILRSDNVTVEDSVAWGTGIYGELPAAAKASKGSSIQRKVVNQAIQDTDSNSLDFSIFAPTPRNVNVLSIVPVVIIPVVATPDPTIQPDPAPVVEPPVDVNPPVVVVIPPIVVQPDPPTVPPTVIIPAPAEVVLPPAVLPDPVPQIPAATLPVVPPEVHESLAPFVISELMINPSAPQTDSSDEWVELYNPNDRMFPLRGYTLQSGSNHSYSYTFTSQTIDPLGFLVVYSAVSHLALSNSSGAARAINSPGEVYGDPVVYEDVEEGNTYALDSAGEWLWTTSPTPGETNIFTKQIELIPPVKLPTITTPKTTSKPAAKPLANTPIPKAVAPTKQSTSSSATKSVSVAPKVAAAATKKTTALKGASTSKNRSSSGAQQAAPQKSRPWVLASFGLLALLYGVYEYRDDLSNTVQRLSRYAKSRRKTRLAMSGR